MATIGDKISVGDREGVVVRAVATSEGLELTVRIPDVAPDNAEADRKAAADKAEADKAAADKAAADKAAADRKAAATKPAAKPAAPAKGADNK